MLLCGFFVSVDELPVWIAWTQWIMPLTYAFRLFLAEEFSSCLDFTVEEQNGINCAVSIQNALGTTGDLSAVYNETSVFRLYATGVYTGRESILEYLGSFSGEEDPLSAYWNACAVSRLLEKQRVPLVFDIFPLTFSSSRIFIHSWIVLLSSPLMRLLMGIAIFPWLKCTRLRSMPTSFWTSLRVHRISGMFKANVSGSHTSQI
jgi:hypothetical protein